MVPVLLSLVQQVYDSRSAMHFRYTVYGSEKSYSIKMLLGEKLYSE